MAHTPQEAMKLAVAVLLLSAATALAGTLDGTRWKIEVVPDKESAAKGERQFADTLIFADGKLTSTYCVPYGYKTSAYNAETTESVSKWKSEQVSEKEGTAVWSGEVKGSKITGEMTCTKKDGRILHYSFSGLEQKEQKPSPSY